MDKSKRPLPSSLPLLAGALGKHALEGNITPRPYPSRMADAEVAEKLDEAAASQRWMAVVSYLADGMIHQYCKPADFPQEDIRRVAMMLLADYQRRAIGDGAVERPWGSWSSLVESDEIVVRLLSVQKGGYCSIHVHRHKSNVFVPLLGRLTVELYVLDEDEPKRSTVVDVEHGKHVGVEPGMLHRFASRQADALVLEISLPSNGPIMEDDISRYTESGRDE